MTKKLASHSFFLALGEGIYTIFVALLTSNNMLLGHTPGILNVVAFLMFLVLSVAISGALIFGKPVLLYLDGKKKEAVTLFGLTLVWLALFLIIAIFIIAK